MMNSYIDLNQAPNLKAKLIGNNGILTHSIIYIPFIFSLSYLTLTNNYFKKYYSPLFLIPIALFIYHSFNWAGEEDTFADRLQLTFLPLFTIAFFYFLSVIKKKYQRIIFAILLFCLSWHLISLFSYLWIDNNFWWTWRPFFNKSFTNATLGFNYLITTFNVYKINNTALSYIYHLPLVLICSKILSFVYYDLTKENIQIFLKAFALYSISSFIIIIVLNIFYNPINVIKYKENNMYSKTVILNNPQAYKFDDYVQISNSAMQIYLSKNDCENYALVQQRLIKYYSLVHESIVRDPINLKDQLASKSIIQSPYQSEDEMSLLKESMKKKCSDLRILAY